MQNVRSFNLTDLKDRVAAAAKPAAEQKPKENHEVLDSKGRVYATGKRKTSVARVWIKPKGEGRFWVNGLEAEAYFPRASLQSLVQSPFHRTERLGSYDVWCTVSGGGTSGQAGALRHGISKALQLFEPGLRSILKSEGMLTRDARRVERKKPGLRKARRSPQFSKR